MVILYSLYFLKNKISWTVEMHTHREKCKKGMRRNKYMFFLNAREILNWCYFHKAGIFKYEQGFNQQKLPYLGIYIFPCSPHSFWMLQGLYFSLQLAKMRVYLIISSPVAKVWKWHSYRSLKNSKQFVKYSSKQYQIHG